VLIVKRETLVKFWESRTHDARRAEKDLEVWYAITQNVNWKHFGSLRQTFGSADQVGSCVVFDVGNNRFRLIGRVNYGAGVVNVLKVMDHPEYDKKAWIRQCGCDSPAPKPEPDPKQPAPRTRKKKR
jgi:mRNA interferase HigB